MNIVFIIFRPIISFTLVASFSLVFMQLFFITGILSARIQRNVIDEIGEDKRLKGYMVAAMGGLIAGGISLVALTFV